MTPEQRDVTRNALRKYGERHWARTPENRRWQSAIDEGLDYYQAHDPMRADLLRMRFFEQRPEDEICLLYTSPFYRGTADSQPAGIAGLPQPVRHPRRLPH